MNVLGIESSCDETAAALLTDGKIVVNEIYSQEIHTTYGGVVPELASRAHLQKIDRLLQTALDKSHMKLMDIDLLAVTDSPGLAGALLVGISFAMGLHVGYSIPVTGIHHLEGHICSVLMNTPAPAYPFLTLVVSGGHTALYQIDAFAQYTCLGHTVDDAAGEAFDKIGKLIGFPYPAGRAISDEAAQCTTPDPNLTFPIANLKEGPLYFSFSGLKTAVKYFLQSQPADYLEKHRPALCHAFQEAVTDSLVRNLVRASQQTGIRSVAVVGGVACNTRLRDKVQETFGDQAFFPPPALCTDNAAMIARAGYERAQLNSFRIPSMKPSRELGA